MKLIPKNWNTFQHYKDRNPPWVKIHKTLLDDREYMALPIASKALAPLLWLLASESKTGEFDGSIEELEFRLRMSRKELQDGLKSLIDKGFFVYASTALADDSKLHTFAVPETETETEKRQIAPDGFDVFWDNYPKKVGKPAALKAFKAAKLNGSMWLVLKDIAEKAKSESWMKQGGQFIPNPATYLNQRRWEDDAPEISVTVPARQGPDPALARIIADGLKAVKPPDDVREKMKQLTGK